MGHISHETVPDAVVWDDDPGRLAPHYHTTLPRQVAGKSLVGVSCFGMCLAVLAIVQGNFGGAAMVFMLTVLVLSLMLERAITRFHTTRRGVYTERLPEAARQAAH